MSKIFDDDDDDLNVDVNFKTDNEYAKNYNKWRNKEEQNRLKTKYGEDIEDGSSSSSDDEDGVEITPAFEKEFFKTLACLKNKDPSIYDENKQFFQKKDTTGEEKPKKKKKDGPMYLKDYERNIILEKGGILSDEEDNTVDDGRSRSPTYIEEQKRIKESFKELLDNSDEEDNDNWGGIFKQRQKTKEETEKEEVDYKNWLAGQKDDLDDKEVETDLKPLKDYWNKPDLDEGEKFLRDYILKKRFLDKEDDDYVPTYDEILHDSDQDLSNDEENIEKQEEFEYKYNFRFEEPDQEFIKRYPRTMQSSLRKTDDKRKIKRQEVKDRKKKEKEEKMQELKKLQELKRQEIEERLDKLREITGNENLGFEGNDVDGDFDPDEHDRKMSALFNDEFYSVEEGEQKPQFPELDEELEIENWDRYDGEKEEDTGAQWDDENFNMDCDYDPQAAAQNDPEEGGKGRKRRKRKSKFAAALSKPKPKYDPNDKNFEKYFDEYFKLDCEDIVGDIPCRFKYRKVVPNDFGLTAEEILLANERELNKWCSLKKAVQIRPDHVEKYEQIAYKKKGENINLKMKILPSLFSKEPENINKDDNQKNEENKNSKKDEKVVANGDSPSKLENKGGITEDKEETEKENGVSLKKKSKTSEDVEQNEEGNVTVETAIEKTPTKNKNKKKKKKEATSADVPTETEKKLDTSIDVVTKAKKKKKELATDDSGQDKVNKKRKRNDNESTSKKAKKLKKSRSTNDVATISDARLSAYGINPKKFKKKLKYAKQA